MTNVLEVTAEQLVAMADAFLHDKASSWGGPWARAVALLARQSLEEALDELWRVRGVDLSAISARAQLLCLRAYLDDDKLAAEVGYTWGALSRACHHHPYELTPTTDELARWVATTRALVRRIHAAEAA
ncbi:MAG: hypothetical protein QOG43_1218 [Actinomycetota bacterium]|jgi:hypothetical protein|nr:hypothetical protein [Actinomycetota bacterium]